jgi:single-stranded DNA-binding protein
LKTDRYEAEGEQRYFTKVVAQTIQFLDSRTTETSEEQADLTHEEEAEIADLFEV